MEIWCDLIISAPDQQVCYSRGSSWWSNGM